MLDVSGRWCLDILSLKLTNNLSQKKEGYNFLKEAVAIGYYSATIWRILSLFNGLKFFLKKERRKPLLQIWKNQGNEMDGENKML